MSGTHKVPDASVAIDAYPRGEAGGQHRTITAWRVSREEVSS